MVKLFKKLFCFLFGHDNIVTVKEIEIISCSTYGVDISLRMIPKKIMVKCNRCKKKENFENWKIEYEN